MIGFDFDCVTSLNVWSPLLTWGQRSSPQRFYSCSSWSRKCAAFYNIIQTIPYQPHTNMLKISEHHINLLKNVINTLLEHHSNILKTKKKHLKLHGNHVARTWKEASKHPNRPQLTFCISKDHANTCPIIFFLHELNSLPYSEHCWEVPRVSKLFPPILVWEYKLKQNV